MLVSKKIAGTPVKAVSMLFVLIAGCTTAVGDYPVRPVPFTDVKVSDSFLAPRLKTHIKVTIPHALKQAEPAVERLRLCGNILHGRGGPLPRTHRFISSDLYKVMEGVAYTLMIERDPQIEKKMDKIIRFIADAQKNDGYLYVSHICGNPNPRGMGKTPYSWVVHSHELYNMGHMYEGAVAYYQATGKDKWLKVAEKNARHINKVFFKGDPNYNDGKPVMQAPGHEELELALCKLYRATGKQLYLDMAKKFLDIRGVTYCPHGEGVMSPRYAQQHKPVLQQTEPAGHVVRAVYMYSGMADIAALTGDERYTKAIDTIWQNIVSKRLYLIGSMGVHGYAEGFGPDYKLPNQQAYCETCATVGTAFLNLRLFLLHQDARYIDVLERGLYNAVLSGVSLKGDEFFYTNPLASDGKNKKHARSPWFGCACCPSNIARFMPSTPGYIYAHRDDDLYVNLYVGSTARIKMDKRTVTITQKTDYPWNGLVNITVEPEEAGEFAILVRIPGWAQNQPVPSNLYRYMNKSDEKVMLKVNGRPVPLDIDKGYVRIYRRWKKGDMITLNMPMPIRRVISHEKVQDNAGRVALERGPVVYCAEWPDNGGKALDIVLADDINLLTEYRRDMLGGITVIKATLSNGRPFLAIPYYAWAHRGTGEMTVWLNRQEKTEK